MQRYDLFKKLSDGSLLWVCADDDLEDAVARLSELDRQTGLEHLVYDFLSETFVATSR